MSHLSISQALQALLPAVHAEQQGLRADVGLSSLQGLPGAAERLAEVPGVSAGMSDSLLRGLDMSPLQSQLAPSLGETLALEVTALDLSAVGTPVAAAPEGVGQEPSAPSHTLQQMAQAASRHDIAAERHGIATDRSMALASAPALDANASTQAPPSRAEPLATPQVRDVQVTPAVASLLHAPATRLRTDPTPCAAEDLAKQHTGRDTSGDDAGEGDDDDDDDTSEIEACAILSRDEATAAMPVPTGAAEVASSASGDPLLYQQIIAALHALRANDGPVQLALEELRRQRRVVLATPAGLNTGLRCQAHVDVLWPSPGGGRAVRLAGELLWSQVTSDTVWLEAHLVKSQGQGNVRQLVPVAAQADPRRVAVCLGAQAMPMTAWSQACLRVRDGTRLWRALGPQWSLRLVVATLPLVLQGQQPPATGPFHAV